MNTPQRHLVGFALVLELGLGAAAGIGCSSNSPAGGGSGGNTSSGGSSGSGGSSASGGTTGSGGASASGGQTGSGGATSSGGTSASGGTTGSGGNSASGGAMATGSGGSGGSASGGGAGSTSNGGTSGGDAGRMGGGAGRMGGSAGSTGGGGSSGATIMLTSPAFMEGGMFPASATCAGATMMGASPELDWTAGPSGTMSYGITLTDLDNSGGLVHWAIWNIPASVMKLPASLATTAMLTDPMGARQANGFGSSGYYGPCPPSGSHHYVFQVYAIPTATLSGNPANQNSARDAMRTAAIATGTLSATSKGKNM